MEQIYDLIVIGGGPGGYVAAIKAAQLGIKTALVEKEFVGGTCLNSGCIPTKSLLHTSEMLSNIKACSELGISVENIKFDIDKVYKRKDTIVKKLRSGIEYLLKNNNVTVYTGEGSFIDTNTVAIKGKECRIIKGKNILIATGSVPAIPPIPGADGVGVWTSEQVMGLEGNLPSSITVIGGGVIGVEIATIFNDFGSKVTIIEMMGQILPGVDIEVAQTLRRTLERKGIAIYTNAKVKGIEGNPKKVCTYEYNNEVTKVESDIVLISAGRRPYTNGLNLDSIGVEQNKGYIKVDRYMKSNVESIYAIGDVTGGIQLAHVASAEGIIAVENIFGKKSRIKLDVIPSCIYTRPEIACIGLTEQQAKDRGCIIKTGKFPMSASGKSLIMGETDGFAKIVADEHTGEILGAQLIGARAADMIGEFAALMNAEGTIDELALAIHPHPTVCETIMEAAHDVGGLCIHLPKKQK